MLAQYRGLWLVASETEEPRLVPARGRLTETPVTGDWVELDEGGAIAASSSAPRHDRPPRARRARRPSGHVLAANVDLALVTEPLPDPKARRLERFAALAASGGVPVALVLTKADLDEDGYVTAARLARRMGVADAVAVSAAHRRGHGRRAPAAHARARPPSCSAPPAPASRRSSTRCSARSARRPARSARPTGAAATPRSPASCSRCPGGAFLIDTPGIRVAGLWDGTGESFADVDDARGGSAASPTAATTPSRAARSARRSTRSGSPPGASSSASWPGSRTAAPPQRQRDEWHKQIARAMRSPRSDESGRGESNPHLWLGKPTS